MIAFLRKPLKIIYYTTRKRKTIFKNPSETFRDFVLEKFLVKEIRQANMVFRDIDLYEDMIESYRERKLLQNLFIMLRKTFRDLEKAFFINYTHISFHADLNDVCQQYTRLILQGVAKHDYITTINDYIVAIDDTIVKHFQSREKNSLLYLNKIAAYINAYDTSKHKDNVISNIKITIILEKIKEIRKLSEENNLLKNPFSLFRLNRSKSKTEQLMLQCFRQLFGFTCILKFDKYQETLLKTEGFSALYKDFILTVESLKILVETKNKNDKNVYS